MKQETENWHIIRLQETTSTNGFLKEIGEEEPLADKTVATAEFQTAGRGQKGNSWFADKGLNLLFSIFNRPEQLMANAQFILSRMISLAVKKTLDRETWHIRIKWPNDIYWNDKKMGGILIESNLQGNRVESTIIGVGLNINQETFPAALPNPVSLRQVTGREHNRETILEGILMEFSKLSGDLARGKSPDIEKEYMDSLYRAHGFHWFESANGRFQAKICGVHPSGHLVLREKENGKEQAYAFKEVQFIL